MTALVKSLGNGEAGEEVTSRSTTGDDKLFGYRHEMKLDSGNGTTRKHEVPLGGRPDWDSDAVNVDENSYHEKTDSQIAPPITDEGKWHALVWKQGGCHAYIDRSLQRDQQEDADSE